MENGRGIALLASETQKVHSSQAGEKGHGAGGKILRAPRGKEGGNFHHQIRSADKGHAGAQVFIIKSRTASLDKIAAYGSHAEGGAGLLFGHLYMIEVPAVKGIVLSDDADGLHGMSSFRHWLCFCHK